jgi:hypothetical protein
MYGSSTTLLDGSYCATACIKGRIALLLAFPHEKTRIACLNSNNLKRLDWFSAGRRITNPQSKLAQNETKFYPPLLALLGVCFGPY